MTYYKLKKHYSLKQRIQSSSLSSKNNKGQAYIGIIDEQINTEEKVMNQELCQNIWCDVKK